MGRWSFRSRTCRRVWPGMTLTGPAAFAGRLVPITAVPRWAALRRTRTLTRKRGMPARSGLTCRWTAYRRACSSAPGSCARSLTRSFAATPMREGGRSCMRTSRTLFTTCPPTVSRRRRSGGSCATRFPRSHVPGASATPLNWNQPPTRSSRRQSRRSGSKTTATSLPCSIPSSPGSCQAAHWSSSTPRTSRCSKIVGPVHAFCSAPGTSPRSARSSSGPTNAAGRCARSCGNARWNIRSFPRSTRLARSTPRNTRMRPCSRPALAVSRTIWRGRVVAPRPAIAVAPR